MPRWVIPQTRIESPSRVHRLAISALTLALLCLGAYGRASAAPQAAPCDWQSGQALADSVRYVRVVRTEPRPLVVHGVQIDTAAAGIGFHTTPRRAMWTAGSEETDRQTTRDFVRAARRNGIPLVVAVNGDAFAPWPAPYRQSTPTDLRGLAIAAGELVSPPSGTPSLLIQSAERDRRDGPRDGPAWKLSIETTTSHSDLAAIHTAMSGFAICLEAGRPVAGKDDLHPRTGIGISGDGRWLYLVVIDGRQPASRGATVAEVGEWLRYFGAERGINMDGGGSSTLAWWNEAQPAERACQLLNSPVGSGGNFAAWPPAWFIPTERANGNQLGISISPATEK